MEKESIEYSNEFYDCWPEIEPEIIEVEGVKLVNYGAGFVVGEISDEITFEKGKTKIAVPVFNINSLIREGEPPQNQLKSTINSGEKIPTQQVDAWVWVDDEHSARYECLSQEDTLSELEIMNNEGVYLTSSAISAKDYQIMLGKPLTYEINNQDEVRITVSQNIIVYNTSFSPEINSKLLRSFFEAERYDENSPLLNKGFVEYHLNDLIDCFGGKEGLISFVRENGEGIENFEEYMEQLSKDIDKKIKEKTEKSFTPVQIAESIEPTQGEIQNVEAETVERAKPEEEKKQEQDGQTQAD